MLRSEVLVLCDAVLRDPQGKFELRGIFDRIVVQKIPTYHREMFFFFRFYIGNYKLRKNPEIFCELRPPKGPPKKMPGLSPRVAERGKVEGFFRLQGLPLQHYGEYQIHLSLDKQHIGYYLFDCTDNSTLQGGQQQNELVH